MVTRKHKKNNEAVSSRHQGKPCAIKGCNIRTMTASTEYCAAHFQALVGKPALKAWLKQKQ